MIGKIDPLKSWSAFFLSLRILKENQITEKHL